MNRRSFCGALAFSALGMTAVLPLHAQAQRPLRVAWASIERPNPASPYLEAFRSGMRELGYTEGKDLVIDTWWGDGTEARLAQQVDAIVRSHLT